jgi:hypothetical protein
VIGVGDLVVCVDASFNVVLGLPSGLVEGRSYLVTGIVERFEGAGLLVDWLPMPKGCAAYCPTRFRKIRPDEHEDCEPEFVTLLNRIKVEA